MPLLSFGKANSCILQRCDHFLCFPKVRYFPLIIIQGTCSSVYGTCPDQNARLYLNKRGGYLTNISFLHIFISLIHIFYYISTNKVGFKKNNFIIFLLYCLKKYFITSQQKRWLLKRILFIIFLFYCFIRYFIISQQKRWILKRIDLIYLSFLFFIDSQQTMWLFNKIISFHVIFNYFTNSQHMAWLFKKSIMVA